jgi:hypothetical protein
MPGTCLAGRYARRYGDVALDPELYGEERPGSVNRDVHTGAVADYIPVITVMIGFLLLEILIFPCSVV